MLVPKRGQGNEHDATTRSSNLQRPYEEIIVENYVAADISVQFDPYTCKHAGHCVRQLKAVFDPGRSPWIDPSAAPAKKIIQVIGECPSGALRYQLRTGPAGTGSDAANRDRG